MNDDLRGADSYITMSAVPRYLKPYAVEVKELYPDVLVPCWVIALNRLRVTGQPLHVLVSWCQEDKDPIPRARALVAAFKLGGFVATQALMER